MNHFSFVQLQQRNVFAYFKRIKETCEICLFYFADFKLFLPLKPVLQPRIGTDEHVVMVIFVKVEASSFNEALSEAQKNSLSTTVEGIGINIPYLTTSEGSKPEVTFQMKLFNKEIGQHIHQNAVLPPPIIADCLIRETNVTSIRVEFEKDDLTFTLIGERHKSCVSPSQETFQDFNTYAHELQVSQNSPNFSICDQLPNLDVDFCRIYRDPLYNKVLREAGSNVCQYWEPADDMKTCKASFHFASISKEMRELLILEDGSKNAIESELQVGTFKIRLVFPCAEKKIF